MTELTNTSTSLEAGKTHEQQLAEAQQQSADLEGLTAAERLQIEQARAERAAAETKAEELKLEQQRLLAQNVDAKFQQNWDDAIKESGVAFYLEPKALLKLIDGSGDSGGLKVEHGGDGRCLLTRNGERVAAREALRQ